MTKLSKAAYRAGYVRRWHTSCDLQQTVAEHSWGVALVILQNHPNPSVDLLKAALLHDLHEYRFGDMPAPVKRRFPTLGAIEDQVAKEFFKDCEIEFPKLSEEDKWWLDLADKIESLVFLESREDQTLRHQMAISAAQMVADIYARGEKLGMGVKG